MKNKAILGIDIGATKVKMGTVLKNGEIEETVSFEVPNNPSPEKLAGMIGEHADKLGAEFSAAGAGFPGHVGPEGRTVFWSPNLGWKKTELAKILEDELSVPVRLLNDVNAAALGENLYGAGKGANHVICIFVGTGIGGGLIHEEKLITGATGNGGEVGHVLFRPGGRLCGCGRKGCVEAYAAGTHIPAFYSESGGEKDLAASEIWDRARAGEDIALKVMNTAVEAITLLAVSLQTLFDSEVIVLGGGVLEHSEGMFERLAESASGYFTGAWESDVKIVRSKLGADAAILGAAAFGSGLS